MAKGILVESRGPEILVLLTATIHSQTGSHRQYHLEAPNLHLHPGTEKVPQNVYRKLLSLRLTTTLCLGRTAKSATWDRNNKGWLSRIIQQLLPQSQHETSQIPSYSSS